MSQSVFPVIPRRSVIALGALCLVSGACSSAGSFVWYSALPSTQGNTPSDEYVLGVGDGVGVRVYGQDGLTSSVKIRSDGRISLALVGEVLAAGKHPTQLARELEGLMKKFVVAPSVTVNVEQSQPIQVNVLGEAGHAGTLTMERPARLLQAIAQAGGLGEYADESKIFVVRQFPQFMRIRFTYEAIMNNRGGAAMFPLSSGDVIVIE